MNCSRCQGLMVQTQLLDCDGAYGQMWTTSLRCVNCGRLYDSVIEQNHRGRQEKVLMTSDGEPDYQDDEVHLGAESFIIRRAA
jgi:hypothetical protein